MICSGQYGHQDRICSLCCEVNSEAYQKCRKYSVERKISNETKVIDNFFAKHCKYAIEYYEEGEDCIGCTLEYDGYYPNCTPFEYDCIHKRKEATND